MIFNRSWVDTRWQQYITHLYTKTHNTEKGKLVSHNRGRTWNVLAVDTDCKGEVHH
jgi:hypothetical protein